MINLPNENLDEILGSLLKEPSILKNPKYKFDVNEFQENHHKIIFSCIYNMHKNGMTDEISSHQFMDYLRSFNIDWYDMYTSIDTSGVYLDRISTGASVKNFEYHYNRLKKFVLLRELQLGGWDISRVIDITNSNTELNMEFELKTVEELLESLFAFNNNLRKKWYTNLDDDSEMSSSDEGIDDLISLFKTGQTFGTRLSNTVLNSIAKGAREGKMVLLGASSGVGRATFYFKI